MNNLNGKRIGFALTGSFCTFETALECMESLVQEGAAVTPVISHAVDITDTKFMEADELKRRITEITGKKPIRSIVEAEPIGPQKLLDVLVVLPATGNTLAKLAWGITDTAVVGKWKQMMLNLQFGCLYRRVNCTKNPCG